MRLAVLKDIHLRYGFEAPAGRTEQFYEQIDNKLRQVIDIAKEYDCKGLISTGDILDKSADYKFAQIAGNADKLKEIKTHFELGIMSVAGNHDLLWASRDYKENSFYGYLVRHNLIQDIATTPIKLNEYTLAGIDYTPDFKTLKDELLELDKKHKKLIMVIHAHLIPNEAQKLPFGDFITYDSITKGLSNTEMIIAGHLHKGYPIAQHNGITIINQWSFTRLARDYYSISGKHTPQVVIIDTDSLHKPVTIDLKVADFDSTFIKKELDKEYNIQHNLNEFVCNANNVADSATANNINNIPLELKEIVEYYLNKAEEEHRAC